MDVCRPIRDQGQFGRSGWRCGLAYRREKLALREIREMSDLDVGKAIQGVSSWQESRRSVSADQELQPLPADVQMSDWLVDWEQGMNQAEAVGHAKRVQDGAEIGCDVNGATMMW